MMASRPRRAAGSGAAKPAKSRAYSRNGADLPAMLIRPHGRRPPMAPSRTPNDDRADSKGHNSSARRADSKGHSSAHPASEANSARQLADTEIDKDSILADLARLRRLLSSHDDADPVEARKEFYAPLNIGIKGAVCRNGHVMEGAVMAFDEYGGLCPECGVEVITKCHECDNPLDTDADMRTACQHCGEPFPWSAEARPGDTDGVARLGGGIEIAEGVTVSREILERLHAMRAGEARKAIRRMFPGSALGWMRPRDVGHAVSSAYLRAGMNGMRAPGRPRTGPWRARNAIEPGAARLPRDVPVRRRGAAPGQKAPALDAAPRRARATRRPRRKRGTVRRGKALGHPWLQLAEKLVKIAVGIAAVAEAMARFFR